MRIKSEFIFNNGRGTTSKLDECKNYTHHRLTIGLLLLAAVILSITLYFGGVITFLVENDFKNFSYPLDIPNFRDFIARIDANLIDESNKHKLNYETLSSTMEKIRASDRSTEGIVPLTQFEQLYYSINVNTSCTQHWAANRSLSNRTGTATNDPLVSVIIVVKSAANNYVRRQAIRETWFANGAKNLFTFKTVFMVGACDLKNPVPKAIRDEFNGTWTPDDCRKAIEKESSSHGDLIQSTGVDSYYNNTIKTAMTLRWVDGHCPSDYFLSLDDDFVFEIGNLEKYFIASATKYSAQHVVSANGSAEAGSGDKTALALKKMTEEYLYAGHVRDFVHPHRHITSKWYVSCKDYSYNKYPRFASGGAVLMSRKTVRHFAIATYFTQTFKFDDVYIGIMASKLNMESLHDETFMCLLEKYLASKPEYSNATNCIGVHDIEPDQLVLLWARRREINLGSSANFSAAQPK